MVLMTVLLPVYTMLMYHALQKRIHSPSKLILLATALVIASPLLAQSFDVTPVNIFGDGDPANGVEDDRQQVLGGRRRGISLMDQRMNAGTIKCDGKVRGTAMVIDTREFAPNLSGVVLVSAAHVLFDLEEGKRFKRCEFHFLALAELARYRVKIDLGNVRMGDFDPMMATDGLQFGEGDWVFLYAAKAWRGYDPNEALVLRDFAFSKMEPYRQKGGELRLIAFDSTAGIISVSQNCTVIESATGDLGGGGWKGQLLDDCDSGSGASGGGIVAVLDNRQYLVGIRGGSHWSDEAFPAEEFPGGPPDGAVWDLHSNTNFGRAIDAQLMQELQEFARGLEQIEAGL